MGQIICQQVKDYLRHRGDVMEYDQSDYLDEPFLSDSSQNEMTVFEEKIVASDLVLLICPVYIRQMPASFKNTLDKFAYRMHEFPLLAKKCVVLTYASTNGADSLCNYFSQLLTSLGGEVLASYSYYLQGAIALDTVLSELFTCLDRGIREKTQGHVTVTRSQEKQFALLKEQVLLEKRNGIVTDKHEGWKKFLHYDSLTDYLSNRL